MESKQRVKVYEMTSDGNWIDKGTGHVQCVYEPTSTHLVVKSEFDGSSVLTSQVLCSTEYSRQQDTLILWTDTIDLALSFQEADR
jgi:protein phosphatase-4 regulatory subunit 3